MFYLLAIYFFTILLLTAYNYFTVRRIDEVDLYIKEKDKDQKVSIIIPIRNKIDSVEALLESIFQNHQINFEVIIVNDGSTDGTLEKLYELKQKREYSQLIITKGLDKPDEWLGKNFAIWQGLEIATGNIFILMDSEVRVSANTFEKVQKLMTVNEAITIFPKANGFSLITQLINVYDGWWLLSNIPIKYFQEKRFSIGAIASEQFVGVKRNSYIKVKTFEHNKQSPINESRLFKELMQNGMSVETLYSNEEVTSIQYSSLRDAINGLSKHFYATNFKSISLIIFWCTIFCLNILPFLFLPASIYFLFLIFEIALIKFFTSKINGENTILSIILHPFQMVAMIVIGIVSVRNAIRNSNPNP